MAKHLIKCLFSIVLLTFFTGNTALLENNVYFCTTLENTRHGFFRLVFPFCLPANIRRLLSHGCGSGKGQHDKESHVGVLLLGVLCLGRAEVCVDNAVFYSI